MSSRDLLRESTKKFAGELTDLQCEQFEMYSRLLREWNEKINLTAITEENEIIIKHFSDSLSMYPYLKDLNCKKISLIDVGTGAGFPGIPLKIVNPDISLTLLDSLDKRINFLNLVLSSIGAKDYNCIHKRAEEAGRDPLYREQFDVCTARAVAKLPVLLEYCLPFVKPGGIFIAMKGSDKGEIDMSKRALAELSGEIIDINEFDLHINNGRRTIIIIKKIRGLSTKYPRKNSQILKSALF